MSAGARRNSAVTFSAQAEAHASPRASPVMVWNCFGTHPPINPLVGCKRSYGWRSGSWNVWWGIAVHDLVCKDTCPQSQRARNRKFADSLLEEPGFEPLVPLCGVVVSRWNRNAGIGEENISKALAAAGTQRSISFAPAIQLHHTSASLGPLGPY